MIRQDCRRRLLFVCLMLARANGFHSTALTRIRHSRGAKTEWLRGEDPSILSTKMISRSVDSSPTINYRDLEKEIVFLGRKGKTEDALTLYYSVEKPTVRLMNSAIDACSRARPTRLKLALEIFEAGVKEKNLKPNVFTFGALMNACNRARNSDQAMALLQSMQDKYGVAPNSVVYSSAISASARSIPPRPHQALELLREAVEVKELQMSVVGFNAAISACAQAGDWENAIGLLNRMEEASSNNPTSFLVPAPDFVTYGTVLSACEKGEQWELVLKYSKSMQDRDLELDGLAFTSCLHACQQLGLADKALHYLHMMKDVHPVNPSTAKLHRFGARQPLRGPDAVAYRLAISACARGGAWQQGIQLLNEYNAMPGTTADVVAYTAAITGCEYAGEWKHAFYLLDRMRKEGVEANEVTMAAVIGTCATACAKLPRRIEPEMSEPQKKALQLLNVLKKDPTLVNPNIQVYNAAIRACAEGYDMKRAFQLLEEIEEAEIERTEITYGSLMTACERVGCMESMSKVFRKLKKDEIVPNEIIYGAAISCCRKARQSDRALLLLRKMLKEGLSPNRATFHTVLVAQVEGRTKAETERAVLIYKLMKSKQMAKGCRPNRQTYTLLINLFASIMQPLTAEEFLRLMRDDGFKPDVDLFTATVASYERTRQPLKALRLMESMQEDGYDFYSVKVLNSAFSNAVKLVNKVGRTLSTHDESKEERVLKLMKMEDEDEDLLQKNLENLLENEARDWK